MADKPTEAWIEILLARPFDGERVGSILFNPTSPARAQLLGWIGRLYQTGLSSHVSIEDFVARILQGIYAKLKRQRLGAAEDLEKPRAYFIQVLRHEALTYIRELNAKKRGGDAEVKSLDDSSSGKVELTTDRSIRQRESELIATIDAKREAANLLHVALTASVPARPRLAFLAWHCIHAIRREHVTAAVAQVNQAAADLEGGLLRSEDETWSKLVALRERLRDTGVADDDDARSELAFILRSRHPGPPKTWALEHPKERATAMDTVRVWQGRAVKAIKAKAGGGS